MSVLMEQVPSDQRDQFLQTLISGKYNLLLGAGASVDSTDKHGLSLPSGTGLTEEINSIAGSSQKQLSDAYEIALDRARPEIENYFKNRFIDCVPAHWWTIFSECVWNRIWTLNVDDVVEQAYRIPNRRGPLLARTYSWRDQLVDDIGLQVVHLHGKVLEDGPLDLIFSISEYVDAIEKKYSWYRKFFDDWVGLPFITIGSSLFGEYDLAQATRAKRPAGDNPSLYISREIASEMREQLEIRNLVGVEMSAEAAAIEIEALTREHRSSVAYQWQSTAAEKSDVARFSAQFELLDLTDGNRPRNHDFFGGAEPHWSDIVDGKAAVFGWHERLAHQLLTDLKELGPVQKLHAVLGDRFSGKTTGAYMVSHIIREEQFPVFLFKGDRRIDIESTLRVLKSRSTSLLVYDGIADFSDDVQILLQKARDQNAKVIVLALERKQRRHVLLQSMDPDFLALYDDSNGYRIDPLNRLDAERLLKHIELSGRYARIQNLNHGERIKKFEDRNIFDAMSEMEFGVGYRDRISPRFNKLPSYEARVLLFLVSFVNSFGYGLPLPFVEASGMKSREVRALMKTKEANDLLVMEFSALHSKYRSAALNTAKSLLSTRDIQDSIVAFMTRLSPYVNKNTKRSRTLEYRILKAVMRARGLRTILPPPTLEVIYRKLEPIYGDDAAFWEQRSIAAQFDKDYAPATSYAARAVDLAPRDMRRRTTFGRLLLVRSYRDVVPGGPESWDFYDRGKVELQRAADMSPRSGLVLLIQLNQTLRLYRELLVERVPDDDYNVLDADIQDIYRSCRYNPALAHTSEQKVVAELYGIFLKYRLMRNGELSDEDSRVVMRMKIPSVGENDEGFLQT
ncbi:hypothetical protein RAJCM14343_1567 [Rhodococcus aetherivorans]|uniref:Novel STAND NTPase 5 domain-containing protein n=1 Tax=Rhodococcus aetherivorans TaxID=191292 RepID=A0ABQ0YIL1_9NOCA|nr:SIR2 family protein [Rhodococcus aetherivorans]ETT28848.1 hypothetical protein RR21198_5806 [Rhodococcus rhodochrous ATCC 21198]NGP29817.1 hypothetical protein [Rhodococcus aetherivorans]GES36316.1 hypothetical protein RAJCM14343_1567 [Rhodococcus aetherivorans]